MSRQSSLRPLLISLMESHHLLSAPEIVAELKQDGHGVNKTSVYRLLEQLSSEKIICKHLTDSQAPKFELSSDHHDHFICENCGTLEKVNCEELELPQLPGKTIRHHHTTFYGLCQNCLKQS